MVSSATGSVMGVSMHLRPTGARLNAGVPVATYIIVQCLYATCDQCQGTQQLRFHSTVLSSSGSTHSVQAPPLMITAEKKSMIQEILLLELAVWPISS